MAELPTQPCIRRTLASVGGTLGGCVEKLAMVTATWAGKGLILNNVLQRVRQQQTKWSNMAMNFCAPRQIFAGRLDSKRLKLSLKTDRDSNPAIWALCNNYLPHPLATPSNHTHSNTHLTWFMLSLVKKSSSSTEERCDGWLIRYFCNGVKKKTGRKQRKTV